MLNFIFVLISGGLFFKSTWINIFHPLVYSYEYKDTAYILTTDGFLFPLVWSINHSGLSFHLLDSTDLHVKDVCCADFDGNKLWIGSADGAFVFYRNQTFKLSNGEVMDVTHVGSREYFLQPGLIYEIMDSKKVIIPNVNGKFLFTTGDSTVLVSGNGILSVLSDSNKILYKDLSFNYYFWDKEKKINPHFSVKLAANGDSGTLIYLGFDKVSKKSKLIYLKEDRRKIKHLTVNGLLSFIIFDNGNFLVFFERSGITFLKVLSESNLQPVDSFRFQFYLSEVDKIYDNYWFILSYGGASYLFKGTNFHKFYNNLYWTDMYRIFSGGKLIDFDKDGDKDLLLLVTSNVNEDIYQKAWGILLLEDKVPEHLNYALSLYNKAKEYNNFLKCDEGLKDLDLALEIFSIILPDSLSSGFRLRESIYQKVYLKGKLKQIITAFLYLSLLVLLPFSLFVLFYVKYNREKELTKTIPSAETIGIILSMDIFHKFSSKWHPIILDSTLLYKKSDEILNEIEEILRILHMPKVKYDFKEAPKEWRHIYKALLSTLLRLRSYIKLYKKFPIGKKYYANRIKESIKTIGELRSSFKELSESAKEDVVTNALLPVIEKIQKEISDSPIKISTDIKTELPYLYYPDEITEIRTAIQAILENAVEAFDNFSPEAPPEIKIKVRSSIQELKIEIEDNGKGIPDEILPLIFDEGFSFGKEGKSRGVGLSNAKRIIDKFGEIAVISRKGKGTKFIIRLIFGKREV